jgi:ferric-dicitrate binding protein FerR (iron transport regulator)
MKLKDLTKKLQLYYDVKIVIQRPALADIVFSGKFRQRDGVMEILQLASKVHPFRMRRDMDKNTIIVY